MDPAQVFLDAIRSAIALYMVEAEAFRRRIFEIWAEPLGFWQTVIPVWFQNEVANRVVSTIDAYQEFQQDVRLIPARVIQDVIVRTFPVPDYWETRVMTAGNALRWAVQLWLETAIAIEDLDLPAEVDIVKRAEQVGAVAEVRALISSGQVGEAIRVGALTLRRTAIGVFVMIAGEFAKAVGSLTALVMAYLFVRRMHGPEGEQVLARFALPQDSRRVWVRDDRARQERQNARKGSDK